MASSDMNQGKSRIPRFNAPHPLKFSIRVEKKDKWSFPVLFFIPASHLKLQATKLLLQAHFFLRHSTQIQNTIMKLRRLSGIRSIFIYRMAQAAHKMWVCTVDRIPLAAPPLGEALWALCCSSAVQESREQRQLSPENGAQSAPKRATLSQPHPWHSQWDCGLSQQKV